MGIISWIVLGGVVGCLASWLLSLDIPGGILGTIFGGAAGAFLGGATFSLIANRGATRFDVPSLLLAAVGAALLLAAVRKADHAAPRIR